MTTEDFIHGGETCACKEIERKKNPFGDVKMKMLDRDKRH